MDWNAAIEKNRVALKRILTVLVAMAGLAPGSSLGQAPGSRPEHAPGSGRAPIAPVAPTYLPRRMHRAVLRLLRPAESAARRLVIVAARGVTVNLPPQRTPKPKPRSAFVREGYGTGIVLPRGAQPPRKPVLSLSLPLLDPLPRPFRPRRAAGRGVPRISSFGGPASLIPSRNGRAPVPARRHSAPDDPIETARLALRLQALGRALDDLPAAAQRFARWQARGNAARERAQAFGTSPGQASGPQSADKGGTRPPRRYQRLSPLRPGRPPGLPRTPIRGSTCKPTHALHEILADLQFFALRALERPDTS